MIRRPPTRIELRSEDLQEFIKMYHTKVKKSSKEVPDSDTPQWSQGLNIPAVPKIEERVGYAPKLRGSH